ncbi:hypothetical protein TNCV_4358121 [Trichonephila clavipes]|nr:hypothetical protein TNCV_4358121 [Trichonephila clavipes]
MHDGASAHFSIVVLNHFHATYPGAVGTRWICCLAAMLSGCQSLGVFLLGPSETTCVCNVGVFSGLSHGIDLRCCNRRTAYRICLKVSDKPSVSAVL